MKVERIYTENGSHIDPPSEDGWDDLTKLQWQAAVVTADTDVVVSVKPTQQKTWRWGAFRANPSMYDVLIPGHHLGMFTFMETWAYLLGLQNGIDLKLRSTS